MAMAAPRRQANSGILPWLHLVFFFFGALILVYNLYETNRTSSSSGNPYASTKGRQKNQNNPHSTSTTSSGRFAVPMGGVNLAPDRKMTATKFKKKLAVIALCRDSDAGEMADSMKSFDLAYNHRYKHDYVIFSETEWKEESKRILQAATNSTVRFPLLTEKEWGTPEWIDKEKFNGVLKGKSFYGNTKSYRHMCRFFAGPVFLTSVLQEYEWAWRMDSHVRYLCDITYDPIEKLEAVNGTYGYALRMTELLYTVPTLWDTVKGYATHAKLWPSIEKNWNVKVTQGMPKVCHYWNNLEATNLAFFQSRQYQEYFDWLDKSGGFFYERWGDAPIRTFGLMLLSTPTQVIQFDDIAYQHPWWFRCPSAGENSCPGREKCTPDPAIQPQQPTDGKMCKVGE